MIYTRVYREKSPPTSSHAKDYNQVPAAKCRVKAWEKLPFFLESQKGFYSKKQKEADSFLCIKGSCSFSGNIINEP